MLKEVVKLRHEFSKQQCEHQHYVSGLRFRLEKEVQGAISAADAERFHFDFEIKALEEELDARIRICRGEEERMVVRRDLNDREIETLNANLDKSEHLVGHAKEQMHAELRSRDQDWAKMMDDLKENYEQRLAGMKDDYEKAKNAQKEQIKAVEHELDSTSSFFHQFYSLQQSVHPRSKRARR